jgi:hypothetical protein
VGSVGDLVQRRVAKAPHQHGQNCPLSQVLDRQCANAYLALPAGQNYPADASQIERGRKFAQRHSVLFKILLQNEIASKGDYSATVISAFA